VHLLTISVSGFKLSIEKKRTTAAAAVCFLASPMSNTRAAQVYALANWWETWKRSVATYFHRLNTLSSVFLMYETRTTPQYANCCHIDSSTSIELYISGSSGLPSRESVTFSTGATIRENSRAFGFQVDDYQPQRPPWIMFVNKLTACLWGPVTRLLKTILLNWHK
jgi:hypothetical protein